MDERLGNTYDTKVSVLPSTYRQAAIIALFFAVGLAIYGGSLRNEFVSWDDSFLIVENPIVSSISSDTIKKAFTSYDPELYIPLTFLTYQVDHKIGGGTPLPFHLGNLILHVLNSLLVAWFLFLMIESGWLAIALGLLFLVHPLNSEAVLWASARKDVLSTFFFLSSTVAYLRYRARGISKLLWLSVGLFFLGLLSKVMVVTLPIVLVLLDELQGRKRDKSMILDKIPYAILAIIFGVVAIFGKTGVLVSSTFTQKILMAAKSSVFYLQKFLWPSGLSVVYPYTKSISFTSPDFYISVFIMFAIGIGMIFFWNRKRAVSIGFCFSFITLTPTFINFAKGGDVYFASDRYAYIPMIGFLAIAGVLAASWFEHAYTVRMISLRKRCLAAGFLALIVLFGFLSMKQSSVWRSSTPLYEHALSLYPDSRAMHNNLGMEQMLSGDVDGSILSFNRALALSPDPKTKVNLAAAFVRKNRLADAEVIYRDILRLDSAFAEAEYGLGNIEQKRGNTSLAVQHYRKAIEIDPDYFNAYNNLGAVYLQLGDYAHAIEILEKSIELKPEFVESSYNLALALIQQKQIGRAEGILRSVVKINPGDADALAHLATLLYDRQSIDAAAEHLQKALLVDSSNPVAVDLVLRMKKDGYVR